MEPYISKGYCVPHKEVIASINKDAILLHQLIEILQQAYALNIHTHVNLISSICIDSLSLSTNPNLIRIISNFAIDNLDSEKEWLVNSALMILSKLSLDSRMSKDFIQKVSMILVNKIQGSDAPHLLCESFLLLAQNRWQDIDLSAENITLFLKDATKRIFSLFRKVLI